VSSRRGGSSTRATKKPIIVVAGESANDREVLRCFLEAFCPQMRGRIVFLNDRVPLRDASGTTLNDRVKRFALRVRARAAREQAPVAAVFLHEDLDDVDWLLLFPEAITSFTNGWQVSARRRGRDTGKFRDPKRIFKDEISKAGTRYRESDAPDIADHIVAKGKHTAPIGSNRSYEDFMADATVRCQELINAKT
jgi:hypothetical protein